MSPNSARNFFHAMEHDDDFRAKIINAYNDTEIKKILQYNGFHFSIGEFRHIRHEQIDETPISYVAKPLPRNHLDKNGICEEWYNTDFHT